MNSVALHLPQATTLSLPPRRTQRPFSCLQYDFGAVVWGQPIEPVHRMMAVPALRLLRVRHEKEQGARPFDGRSGVGGHRQGERSRATRNPIVAIRLPVMLQTRAAARRLGGSPSHAPPRSARRVQSPSSVRAVPFDGAPS